MADLAHQRASRAVAERLRHAGCWVEQLDESAEPYLFSRRAAD
jgi:hypothetical protein